MAESNSFSDTQAVAWHGLITIIYRAFPEMERTLKEYGLLAVHYHIFMTLSLSPGQTLRLGELASLANLSQSRLTHRLGLLVDRGYVEIAEDPDDRRAKNATLTPAGRRKLAEISPNHIRNVKRLIFEPLTDAQTESLADALSTIAAPLCPPQQT